MLDSLGQSNNYSTFGIRDPGSGSLHTDADRRKRSLEQQERAEEGNQQRLLHQLHGRPGIDLIAVLPGSIQITEQYKPRSVRSFVCQSWPPV